MKVLIVCSYNSGKVSPFILDQVFELKKLNVCIDFYLIKGKGILGYLSNLLYYYKKIKDFDPDLIHAHFGLSGFFASLQFFRPVVVTFHGSDINVYRNRLISMLAIKMSNRSIFVSNQLRDIVNFKRGIVIPCGVDIELFKPIDKIKARNLMNLDLDSKLVLFSSSFDRSVKNPILAIRSVDLLEDVRLIELKDFSRQEVSLLMNSVDVCLLTSFSEGSPQFIKEAICCDSIVVSTRVGDIQERFKGVNGIFFCEFDFDSCSKAIFSALNFDRSLLVNREFIRNSLDNRKIAKELFNVYNLLV